MKTKGVYYLPYSDVIWYVTKVEYYEDLYNPSFSIISVYTPQGFFKRVCITGAQFNRFVRVGAL